MTSCHVNKIINPNAKPNKLMLFTKAKLIKKLTMPFCRVYSYFHKLSLSFETFPNTVSLKVTFSYGRFTQETELSKLAKAAKIHIVPNKEILN